MHTLANSEDPVEMPNKVDLHCLLRQKLIQQKEIQYHSIYTNDYSKVIALNQEEETICVQSLYMLMLWVVQYRSIFWKCHKIELIL